MNNPKEIKFSTIEEMAKYLRLPRFTDYNNIIDPQLPFEENLMLIMKEQCIDTKARSLDRRLKLSGLPLDKTFETFKLSKEFFPHLDINETIELRTCKFIDKKLDIIALGNSGRGKTHLVASIGNDAVRKGYSVIFKKTYNMIDEMREAKKEKNLRDYVKRLSKVNLLIIDEIGFDKYDDEASKHLFKIISERYEKASTIYTSNYHFDEWKNFISDTQIAKAAIDRIIHHSILLNMSGDKSWRFENAYSNLNKREKNINDD
jgi:DNA replication protein DnaC